MGLKVRHNFFRLNVFGSHLRYFRSQTFRIRLTSIFLHFRVYGNVTEESDWDFILIVKDPPHFELEKQKRTPKRNVDEMEKRFKVFELNRVNGMLVPISDFKAMLMEHRHEALECIYLPSKHVRNTLIGFNSSHQAQNSLGNFEETLTTLVFWSQRYGKRM